MVGRKRYKQQNAIIHILQGSRASAATAASNSSFAMTFAVKSNVFRESWRILGKPPTMFCAVPLLCPLRCGDGGRVDGGACALMERLAQAGRQHLRNGLKSWVFSDWPKQNRDGVQSRSRLKHPLSSLHLHFDVLPLTSISRDRRSPYTRASKNPRRKGRRSRTGFTCYTHNRTS